MVKHLIDDTLLLPGKGILLPENRNLSDKNRKKVKKFGNKIIRFYF